MRPANLAHAVLASALAMACSAEQEVEFVEDVDALMDVLAQHRYGHPTVIELGAGRHLPDEVIHLPPFVTLRGDSDGGTVIDGSEFFPIDPPELVRPWRLVECRDLRPSIFPQPIVEFTQSTIEHLTFENGDAYLGPALDTWERSLTLRNNTFRGMYWEEWGWGIPVVGVDAGNAGCIGTAPHHTEAVIEGNRFDGGFLGVAIVNRATAPGASWTAQVRDNVFTGLYTAMVVQPTNGDGDLEASGNEWIDNPVGGINLGAGGDAPVLFVPPFGTAFDTDDPPDGVPDEVRNEWYGPSPFSLAGLAGIDLSEGDPAPEQLADLDFGWQGPFPDATFFVLPVRDGGVDGFLFARLEDERFDNNQMSLLAIVEHHDALAAPSTGNWLDLEIADTTFGSQQALDILAAGSVEFGGEPCSDNLTTLTLKGSSVDACAFGSTLFPDPVDSGSLAQGFDPGTHGPDQWGNTL
ncbi:MAG: hypothetical protein JRI25_07440 [Deltaproteobacteria bacterium]|nr:hypothetical protein [Deltaproteobacteria bacterium]